MLNIQKEAIIINPRCYYEKEKSSSKRYSEGLP